MIDEMLPVVLPVDRIAVPFAGEGAGEGDLSWGQRDIWAAMSSQDSSLALGGTKPFTPDTTLADVAGELSYLMGRYQSMRTRLRFGAGGRPRQVLSPSGEVPLEVFDAGDIDPAEVAETIQARYRDTRFDYEHEWPVRMGVVRSRGVLTHMVVFVCHLVTDASGAMVMLREVAARVDTPPTGMQPLAQAAWQQSPAGQRQNAAAQRYWEGLLRSIAPRRLPGADGRDPRHWEGLIHSPALLMAVRTLAERTQVDSSPVLLGLFAIELARVTGINPVVTRPVVGNRFRAGMADVVCMLAQNGICAVDVADVSVDDAIRRAQQATMTAYKYAYYDPEQMAALIAKVSADRGPDFNVSCYFNDRRVANRTMPSGPAATERQMREAMARTTFVWHRLVPDPYEPLFLHIEDVPDAVRMSIDIDTAHLSPEDAEAMLFGMEGLAVEAALDPAARTRVAPTAVDL